MNAHVDRPIGMFDSGLGGLTVARAVIDSMPSENLVYIGDTARYPYGPKPASDVRSFAIELATSLVRDFNAKLIVVACNTAASVALGELQSSLSVPVIGVVEPGARALVQTTKNKRVAVIGTVGTIASGAYENAVASASREISSEVVLTAAACPGFVEFVERDETSGKAVTDLAEKLLAPIRKADPGGFWSGMQDAVDTREDILKGMLKAAIFAVVVTWIAVFQGYDCEPTAEGMGRATTRTVVTSSVLILALDIFYP